MAKRSEEIKIRMTPHTKQLFRAKAAIEGLPSGQILHYFVKCYAHDDICLYDFVKSLHIT